MCICSCCAEWMDGHDCVAIWRLSGHQFIQSSFVFVIIPLSVSQAWALGSQSLCVFIYILVKFSLVMSVSQSPIHSKNTSRVCFARTITEIFLGSIQHAIIASSGAIERASNQTIEHIYWSRFPCQLYPSLYSLPFYHIFCFPEMLSLLVKLANFILES